MKRRSVCAGLVLPLLLSACSLVGQDALVDDPDLTKDAAIEQTLEYLKLTEAELPAGMTLSANSDAPGARVRDSAISGSLPCSSSDGARHTDPHFAYVGYFVNGVPQGDGPKYLQQISELWESWGWAAQKELDGQSATYVSEHGYTLQLQTSIQGEISVKGETPCIGGDHLEEGAEVPMTIGGGES